MRIRKLIQHKTLQAPHQAPHVNMASKEGETLKPIFNETYLKAGVGVLWSNFRTSVLPTLPSWCLATCKNVSYILYEYCKVGVRYPYMDLAIRVATFHSRFAFLTLRHESSAIWLFLLQQLQSFLVARGSGTVDSSFPLIPRNS